MKRFIKLLGLTLMVAALFTGSLSVIHSSSASALSGSEFQSGRIMDDAIFFNPSSMGASDIQAFLNAKVPACDTNGSQPYAGTTRGAYGASKGYPPPYTCLKDYSQAIPSVGPDTYCPGTVSGGTKSAAQIIYDVAQACGVSPKVLLVLLQKEQGLVTDDWPWSSQYTAATGYGCPDTASCDPSFAGFFNQLYYGARQYQRYAKQPSLFTFKAGQTNYVQYNPNAGCGGGNVAIVNQTTAGLYNYTPYQPNAAALSNLYGTGDSCSAYGNRNFWRLYSDWFGPTFTTVPFAWSYEGQWAYSDAGRTQPFTAVPTVAPGGKFYVRIKARNMGNQAWNQSFMHLGASRPMDRVSQFADSGWLSNTRPAQLIESSVAPGQIGTFEFAMQAPNTAGTYNEYFNLVAEGHTWLNDLGLYFKVNVNGSGTANNSNKNTLASGESITKTSRLMSVDSQSVLALQSDGNLVLNSNFQNIWQTGTSDPSNGRLIMQTDGNLVLYNQSGVALWSTATQGNSGARLVIQTDGNMVVYSSSNVALWASYTTSNPDHLSYINTFFGTGRLYPGQSIDTADRRYHLIMQGDGNLVLYSPSRAIWASGTDGKSVAFLAMQGDGNLVLYGSNYAPLWYSRTAGQGPSNLVIQPDGNLVLYNQVRATWASNTVGQ